jgi:hypothetical protein
MGLDSKVTPYTNPRWGASTQRKVQFKSPYAAATIHNNILTIHIGRGI